MCARDRFIHCYVNNFSGKLNAEIMTASSLRLLAVVQVKSQNINFSAFKDEVGQF
jgi:hypothetical protein